MNGADSIVRLLGLTLLVASFACGDVTMASPYWKNKIVFPDDEFRVVGDSSAEPDWVKFTILLSPFDPEVVYFQDCRKYVFHYDFALRELDPFAGMSREEFDAATLYANGQRAILGAVVLPPTGGWPEPTKYREYGIQFVGRDAYTREQIRDMFNIVKASVAAEEDVEAFYFPSYEQTAVAEANREWFASEGIGVSSAARWANGNICYSEGWALGQLKYFSADEIESAYLRGDLTGGDILLTDGVPAEIPMVAGVVSLGPSSPNSHVAILTRTYGVPFVYLALAADAQRAQELVGRRVVLRGYNTWQGCDVRLIDAEGLDEGTVDEILELKRPGELDIQPMATYGSYSASTDLLGPGDIKYFGGKAANFGILRDSIGGNCPVAAAFSFDLWNAYLDQTIVGGNTLRQEIAGRLSGMGYPPADMGALSSTLAGIRGLFRSEYVTSFSAELQDAVVATLNDPQYGFDRFRKIRFRSSTNVEDSEQFSGAGLYDSYSGCLGDDLDGNSAGPCLCDPTRNNERGVFRAIRRVFASFYNDNAYIERLRHGVNENDVGMAILVHHSFPDEIEMANGVATLVKSSPTYSWHDITLVTQAGATSVSNPTDGSIPEEVDIDVYSTNYYATVLRESNLVALGDTVMEWQADYIDLSKLLVLAGNRYGEATGKDTYVLDFEYKKVAPFGDLVVKQIRAIPQPGSEKTITPFLINEPTEYSVFQGESSNVFGAHRLKSVWDMQTRNMWLTQKNLRASIYSDVRLDLLYGVGTVTREGGFAGWPGYRYSFSQNRSQDVWMFDDIRNARNYSLQTQVWYYSEDAPDILVAPAESPILTLSDLNMGRLYLEVTYDQPVPFRDWTNATTTTTDTVSLRPTLQPDPGDKFQRRTVSDKDSGISIDASFYWPPHPTGATAGYTAPLVRWEETVIEGLTDSAIVLRGNYSQTYGPAHHNFSEEFIFEPRLEAGISPDILNQLRQKDIRMIYCILDIVQSESGVTKSVVRVLNIIGFDKDMYPADLDGDGDVGGTDLGLFGEYWRRTGCGACGGADFTDDGQVRFDDLAVFAIEWLSDYYRPQ